MRLIRDGLLIVQNPFLQIPFAWTSSTATAVGPGSHNPHYTRLWAENYFNIKSKNKNTKAYVAVPLAK